MAGCLSRRRWHASGNDDAMMEEDAMMEDNANDAMMENGNMMEEDAMMEDNANDAMMEENSNNTN